MLFCVLCMAQTEQLAGKVCTKYYVVCCVLYRQNSWQGRCVLNAVCVLCMAQTEQLAGKVCTKCYVMCCVWHRQSSWQVGCVLNTVLCVVHFTDRTAGREGVYKMLFCVLCMAQTEQLAGKVCTKYGVECCACHRHGSW